MMKNTSGPNLGAGGTGMVDYGTDGAPNAVGQRRPHTAHGGRGAGFPSSSQPIAGGVYSGDPNKGQAMYNDGGEEVSSYLCGSGAYFKHLNHR
jgi:hypothetical protein